MSGVKDIASKRVSKPVQRFGEPIPTETRKYKNVQRQVNLNNTTTRTLIPSASISSRSSRQSQASAVIRQIQIDKKTNELIAVLEEELQTKKQGWEKETSRLTAEIETHTQSIVPLQVEKDDGCTDERREEIAKLIQEANEAIRKKKQEINFIEIDRKFEIENTEARKARIIASSQQDKEIVDVEEELKANSDEEISENEGDTVKDKQEEIQKWAEDVEATQNEEERFRKLTEELLYIPGARKFPPHPQYPEYTPSNDTAMQTIASALQALTTHAIAPPSNNDRFLARQVQGKDLPFFNGRPEEWPAFISAFENSTKNCQYSTADNLVRLQKCLKGEALKSVQGLLIDPASVPSAIKQLRMRYGTPDHIIEAMMTKAKETVPIKSDKPETFIEFGIAVNNLRAMIKALKCPQHLNNPILLKELVQKLPFSDQRQWLTWVKSDISRQQSIDTFADWIEVQTELACSLCPPTFKTEAQGPRNSRRRNEDNVHAVTEEDKSSNNRYKTLKRKDQTQAKCQYCNNTGHRISSCSGFTKLDPQDRWKHAREKQLCFGCLNGGHSFNDCRSKRNCSVRGCSRQHHNLLHVVKNDNSDSKQNKKFQQKEEVIEEEKESDIPQVNGTTNAITPCGYISLKVLPVWLTGSNGRRIKVLAFLDDGSSLTILDDAVAQELGLEGSKEKLNISCFQSQVHLDSKSVNLTIESIDGRTHRSLSNVKTAKDVSLPQQSIRKDLVSKYDHLKGLNIESYDTERPRILIGMDNADLVLCREIRLGKGNAPIAARTLLGWTLCGLVPFRSREQYGYHIYEAVHDPLHQLVKHYFTTEAFGVMPCAGKPRSKDDQKAQKVLDSTLKRVDNGWECGLLWRDEDVQLPPSRHNAMKRLKSMERKMDQDPEFAKAYQDKIDEYINKGYASKLTPEEAATETGKTYYLPHFMAVNRKKKKKYRFVFDAASKSNGFSLNDHLLQGPDKMVSLPGVLLKFRQRSIGFTADIQDMFHRVKVRHEDAQAQRFLFRGLDRVREPDVYEMGVIIFGGTCSPSIAGEAKDKNAEDFKKEYPAAYKAIVEKHYVDDYIDSCDNLKDAIQMFNQVRFIHEKGGFNLCNWISSSQEMMALIPENLRSANAKDLAMDKDTMVERVLGLFWKPQFDEFTFSLSFLRTTEELMSGNVIPTKRELLSLTMSIYDPLGFLSTLIIKARCILRATWRCNVDWNDQIPHSTHQAWYKWVEEMMKIPSFQLQRCYSQNFSSADEIQLHVFGDAGEEAFGAVAYFAVKTQDRIETSLVMAKARVSPMKTLSIPRLELQAAVMGCRIFKTIQQEIEIKIDRIILWSDSKPVLGQIRSEGKRHNQFVGHRVGEIQENSEIHQWRWVPTALNVADEMTRPDKPCDWSPTSRWILGPDFLKRPESEWPQEVLEEKREEDIFMVTQYDAWLNPDNFSSWLRLVRFSAQILKFIDLCRSGVKGKSNSLTPEEFIRSERWWWVRSQKLCYPKEYSSLLKGEKLERNSKLLKVCPYLDDYGVMRVRGRIDEAEKIGIQIKRPVILDSKDAYTKLLLRFYHNECGHQGHERMVNEIRQKFYISNIRAAVKKTKSECQQCRNNAAVPVVPEMGSLPKYRLQSHIPQFNSTGVDYFGPIEVVVKRSREKRYGVLFTCLSTRAIHLEVATSLSTDSCILAIRRFVGRRGCPQNMYSDNGTNFHGARNELKRSLMELNQSKLEEECTTKGIQWNFIPPAAPHMGGSLERMVRAVKTALGATLQLKNLSDEVLLTVMVEAEHVVNSHPLTYVPDDPSDPEALTPNHFLLGRSSNLQPIGSFDTKEIYGRKQWRVSQQLADHFWRRWIQEYLPTLLRREKWCQITRPIKVGDVVVEVNANLCRNSWPKARVTNVFPGKDGLIRVVEIKMSNGYTYKRPVSKLCILDVIQEDSSIVP